MADLIDKEATLKKMCESCGYCEKFEKAMRTTHPYFVADKCNNYKFLAEQPAIEPEVRHGRWMFIEQKSGYLWKCSNCKGNFDQRFSYCPHCGAKMDGGAENDSE